MPAHESSDSFLLAVFASFAIALGVWLMKSEPVEVSTRDASSLATSTPDPKPQTPQAMEKAMKINDFGARPTAT